MKNSLSLYDLIHEPILTEKSSYVDSSNQSRKKYFFYVSKYANKNNLFNAFTKIFDVEVNKINIINVKGKIKKFRGKPGKRADKKKAIITLEPGSEIDFTNIKMN